MHPRSLHYLPRHIGLGAVMYGLVLTACGDGTTPTTPESPGEPGDPPPARSAWTPPGPGPASLPAGRLLSDRWFNRIVLTTADDGDPIGLADDATLPSWSPDGTLFAFVSYREPEGYVQGDPLIQDLCVARADGSETRCLAGAENPYHAYPASWSPDGGRLAYSTWSGNEVSGLQILDIATMTSETVTDFPVLSPSWSPDGSRIAVVYDWGTHGFSSEGGYLGTVAPDGTGFRTLSRGTDRYLFSQVVWSPSGSRLAFTLTDTWNCPVGCWMSLGWAELTVDETGLALSPLNTLLETWIHWEGLAWSPDETSLAFVGVSCAGQEGCDGNFDVMSIGLTGGVPSLLAERASWPAWSR